MNEIKNIHQLIPGFKYRIEYPCYDDYDEGLIPEVVVVEVIRKLGNGFLLKDLELNITYESTFKILMDCKIEKIDD